MKKIIHLSDLHYGWQKQTDVALQTIITNILFEKEPASDYVVVVTGDLVNNAHDKKHKKVRASFDKLVEEGFTVLVVPGNHDYGNGILGSSKFVPEFKKIFFNDKDRQYPKLDIVYDRSFPDKLAEAISFIGLDSMAEELGLLDHLWAEGELGEAQLLRLEQILNKADVRACGKRVIYLHHHPFDPLAFHQLKDSEKLREVINAYVEAGGMIDALLFGHNHLGRSHLGKWNILRCYDGSSSTGKKKDESQPVLQRVMDLRRDPRWDYSGDFHLRLP